MKNDLKLINQERDNRSILSQCPVPISKYPMVTLAHGGGGRLMNDLIDSMMVKTFSNELLDQKHDSTVFLSPGEKIAMSTDSFTVKPLFFPGGNIGSLAIHGTVNDIAMSGAKPLYLSLGLIIEEGLSMEHLWEIVYSMKMAADHANVKIITGDTKVVEKGKGDGIYINTTGIGVIETRDRINPSSVKEGDVVLINGDLGRHGMAIMAKRENLEFESEIESDSASLVDVVDALIKSGIEIHMLRDLTRGGLASALNETTDISEISIEIDEKKIPVHENVKGALEILGMDSVYVANEGKFMVILPEKESEKALEIMCSFEHSKESTMIGKVVPRNDHGVYVVSSIGTKRILDMIAGEQLPRIC